MSTRRSDAVAKVADRLIHVSREVETTVAKDIIGDPPDLRIDKSVSEQDEDRHKRLMPPLPTPDQARFHLEQLAAALRAHWRWHAEIAGTDPVRLEVTNPSAMAMTDRVLVTPFNGSVYFRWGDGEPITPVACPRAAADLIHAALQPANQ